MVIHTTAPGPSFSAQRGAIADASPPQALSREQADGNLGLVQPTAVLGVWCTVNRSHSQPPAFSPNRSTTALRVCELRLSNTKWIVSATG